ncbi:MAG: TIGR03621 family F420-dependent LLM class oxidoreductase [Gammaproteobacteria bacterium]
MTTPRAFRFAVQTTDAASARDWRDQVRRAEDLGYSAFHLADHYMGPGAVSKATGHPPQGLASVPAIMAAACASSTIRVGCRVFCTGYKPAAVLVKEAMTLDFLSEGRLELGLGAGWTKQEYEALGLPFDPPAERIERLAETIELVRQWRRPGEVDVNGRHVRVHGFEGAPRPVGHLPIMIGGGSRRVLELAAREADIISVNFNNRSGLLGADGVQTSTHDATLRKLGWIRAAAGTRMAEIELEIGAYFTTVTADPDAAAGALGAAFGLSGADMRRHPHALIGTVDAICEELQRRRELFGFSYITIIADQAQAFAPVVARLNGR